jgi:adenylylsulfate kinase
VLTIVTKSTNVVRHAQTITREHRTSILGHRSTVLWFTGLSGSGKSTLAHAVEEELHRLSCLTYVLDGDNVRHGLCRDLSFTIEDRVENIRRVAEVAKLMVDAGVLVLTAFISPLREDRAQARAMLGNGEMVEIYCRASIDVCEGRDVKGLYKRARAGEIPHFTGISSPYEEPAAPELVVDTGSRPLKECVDQVITYLADRGTIVRGDGDAYSPAMRRVAG